jgi:hypothetical protein
MKISELKEGFADWAADTLSRDTSSAIAPGSKKVQKIFINDFKEDFRNGLDSAIKSGAVFIGRRPQPNVSYNDKPAPEMQPGDLEVPPSRPPKATAADLGLSEQAYNKMNAIFETIVMMQEQEGAQTVSEWGLDWWEQYMQRYNFDQIRPQVKQLLAAMENAYSQQGIKGKMQGLMQFNKSLDQLANLAWSLERTRKMRPGLAPSGGGGAGGSGSGGGGGSSGGNFPEERTVQTLMYAMQRSPNPEQTLTQALNRVSPALKTQILAGLMQKFNQLHTPANDEAYNATKKVQLRLI